MRSSKLSVVLCGTLAASLVAGTAWGNGGPFVIKYPGGDPAARGVLARIDPNLKPARETRLRVVKEDLTITFGGDEDRVLRGIQGTSPLALVTAAYQIENPTDEPVTVDFGFPILRGIYMSPRAMTPRPDVHVTVDGKPVTSQVISNSIIYGVIRMRARKVIDAAIAADEKLAELVEAVPKIPGPAANAPAQAPAPQARQKDGIPGGAARKALLAHLTGPMKWNPRDAQLLVEYASLDLGPKEGRSDGASVLWTSSAPFIRGYRQNLGTLAYIGEQRPTQMLAHLAAQFDPTVKGDYEAIFTAWGGDVRERSIDPATGAVRPREIELPDTKDALRKIPYGSDPTVYARVDYLDDNPQVGPALKSSLRNVLKNLPVVFTFAPMNLLHYQATFPPKTTREVTVNYGQYAYLDTRDPATYQLSYVIHPASLWDSFGPIHLRVQVREGIQVVASVPLTKGPVVALTDQEARGERIPLRAAARTATASPQPVAQSLVLPSGASLPTTPRFASYEATIDDARSKRGEWFFAIDKATWDQGFEPRQPVPEPPASLSD